MPIILGSIEPIFDVWYGPAVGMKGVEDDTLRVACLAQLIKLANRFLNSRELSIQ